MSFVLTGTPNEAHYNSPIVSGFPFTVAFWFKPEDDTSLQELWSITTSATAYNYFMARYFGGDPGDPPGFTIRAAGSPVIEAGSTGTTLSQWHHLIFVAAAANDYRMYLNGNLVASSTTSISPALGNTMSFGVIFYNGSTSNYFTGSFGYAALWDTALGTLDRNALAAGSDPADIATADLLAAWNFVSDGNDSVNGYNLLVNGAFNASDNPPIVTYLEAKGGVVAPTQLTDIPEPKSSFGFEELGGLLYAVAGGSTGGTHSDKMYAYDPGTDTWAEKASVPNGIQSPCLRAVNGKLYLIGGYNSTTATYYDNVYEYDPDADTWTEKTNMPIAMEDMGSAVIDGKIYIFGGHKTLVPEVPYVYVYDPVGDSWETRSWSNPKTLGDFAASYGGYGYVVSAVEDMSSYSFHTIVNPVASVKRYDADADTFSSLADIGTPVCYAEISEINGVLYVFSGCTENFVFSEVDQAYDIALDRWVSWPNQAYASIGMGQAEYDGSIYFGGGLDTSYANNIASLYKFTPITGDDISGGSGTLEKYTPTPPTPPTPADRTTYNILNLQSDLNRS